MAVEASLRNKKLYKIEPCLLKALPMIIALFYLINTVTSYFNMDIPILSSVAGLSIIPLMFIYVSSYAFKFCEYHRMFLYYMAINDTINIYDYYIGIPLDNLSLFSL